MIARRALVGVLNNVLGALLGLVALNFVTAYGGKTPWGIWIYASSLLGLASIVTGLGFPSAHVKRVSEGGHEATANATYLWVKLGLTAAFALLAWLGIHGWTRVLHKPLQDVTEAVLYLALVYFALLSIRQFFDATFQAHRLAATAESVLFVDTLFTVGGVMTAALSIGRLNGAPVPLGLWADLTVETLGLAGPLNDEAAAFYLAVGYVAGKAISLLYAAFQFLLHRHPLGRPDLGTLRSYAAFAFPVAVVGILYAFTTQVDRVFLGYFWTPEVVAEYNLALLLLNPMFIVSTSLGLLLFPTLSASDRAADPVRVQALVRQSDRYLSMLMLPQVMLAIVFAKEALRVVSSSHAYDAAGPILQTLTVFVFFNSLLVPTRSLVLGFDRPGILARLGLLNAGLVVALNLLFVPTSLLGVPLLGLGGLGAALVAALLGLGNYAYLRYHSRRWLEARALPHGFARQVLAATAAGVLLWAAKQTVDPTRLDRVLELAFVGLLGFVLYGLLLVLVRGFDRHDLRFLLDLGHPGKLARYLGTELGGRRAR